MAKRKKKAKKKRRGFRAAARSVGRRLKRFRRRRPQMGFIGKAGVGVAGIAPVGFGAVEAASPWMDPVWGPYSISTKMKASGALFLNTLSNGFGLGDTIPVTALQVSEPIPIPAGMISRTVYAGAWLKTTAVGVTLVVIDGVIGTITRIAAGGRTRPKFFGRQAVSG